jgi:hypothetical protein
MRIHPKTFAPRPSGDMDLPNTIERHALYYPDWIQVVIHRIAVNIVEIEELEAPATFGDSRHQPAIVGDVGVSR